MDEQTPLSDDLRRYLALLWQWAWLLALSALLAAGAAYAASKSMAPVYQASTLMLINEAPNNRAVDYTALITSERLAQTYAEILTTRPVLEGVAGRLGLKLTPAKLKSRIEVKPVRDTQLIQVLVEDTDPNRAALIANALVLEFAEQNLADQASRFAASKGNMEAELEQLDVQIQDATAALARLDEGGDPSTAEAERSRIETVLAQYRQTYASLLQSYEAVRLAEAQSTSSVLQKESAVPPLYPIRPRTMVNTLLAGVVGLLLAVGVIFLIEALDDTLKSPDDAARLLGLPILGMIARHETEGQLPVTMSQPRSPVSEAFRSLRTNIQYAGVDRPIRSILVSSPTPSDGKTTVAVNLSAVLSQGGRRVLLLDADLRRPRVHRQLKLSNRSGMSDFFVREQPVLNGSLQPAGSEDFFVLTSGRLPPNPSELLGSEKMVALLDLLRGDFDTVVIDTPPSLAVTDAAVLSSHVDGVILVIKPGKTKLAAARSAVEGFRRVGANLLGVVLNDIEFKHSRYGYYQYQDYYYTPYASRSDRPFAPLSHPTVQSLQAIQTRLASQLKALIK